MDVSMKVHRDSFRRLDDPLGDGKSKKYIFYVQVDNVAEGIPMVTNPRDQKLKSPVAEAITDSLLSDDGYFHLKNRGIVLSAEKVRYNSRIGTVDISFSDESCHGDIDGGHTYKIVCANKGKGLKQFVQFEVMIGVEDIIENLAEARNTSVQVDAKSMAELRKQFDPIKEALEGMPFFERIAFRQNQVTTDAETGKGQRMIDAREIVAIISMFNVEQFGKGNHPISAYNSKAKVLELYLKNPEQTRKYVNVIPDIFDLYDAIECEFAETYNNAGGRYGRKTYSNYKDGKIVTRSKFFLNEMQYKIPDGLIYPIVGAFRTLLVFNSETEKYEWTSGKSPLDVWAKCKGELVPKVMNFSTTNKNDKPNTVGKDPTVWDICYMIVQIEAQG